MEKGNRKPQNYLSREEYLKLPPQEQKAFQELVKMESATKGAHALGRHGPNTTLEQQYTRATTGVTPDGKQMRPENASRYFSYKDMELVIQQAKQIRSVTKEDKIIVVLEKDIGEGYTARKAEYRTTREAVVIFNENGEVYTSYPNIGKAK